MRINRTIPTFLSTLCLFISFVCCIYDDELNQLDWIQRQIGNFNPGSVVLTNSTVYGLSDANLFVALSTIGTMNSGAYSRGLDLSILFRKNVNEDHNNNTTDANLIKFKDYAVVSYTQGILSYIDVYLDLGQLVYSKVFENQKVMAIANANDVKLVVWLEDATTIVFDGQMNAVQAPGFELSAKNGTVMASIFGDKIMASKSDKKELYIYDQTNLKMLKQKIPNGVIVAMNNDKVLMNDGTIYDIGPNLKLRKLSGIKKIGISGVEISGINEHGYLQEEISTVAFHNYENELIYQSGENTTILHNVLFNDYLVIFEEKLVKIIDVENGIELESFHHGLDLLNQQQQQQQQPWQITLSYIDGVLQTLFQQDEVIELYKNERLVWTRDESLSHVQDFKIIDAVNPQMSLREEISVEENSNVLNAFIYRWRKHLSQLLTIRWRHGETDAEEKEAQEQMKRNFFGLNKKLVVLTKSDKLICLNVAQHGEMDWKTKLDQHYDQILHDDNKLDVDDNNNNRTFFLLNLELGLVDQYSLNSNSSELIIRNELGEPVVQTHYIDHATYLETESGKIISLATYSKHGDTLEDEDISKYTIKSDSHSIYGLKLTKKTVGFSLNRTWTMPLDKGEKLLTKVGNEGIVVRPDPNNDVVASIGVVTGDRKVMYKYLVPNLAVFSTMRQGHLTIRLISVLSGEVLHVIEHDVEEFIEVDSFQLIYDENFIIYTYYSYVPTLGTKIVVVDMFESLNPNENHYSSSKSKDMKKSQFDNEDNDSIYPPVLMSNSFNFAHRIIDMIISRTRYNISTKNVLLLTSSGQIIAVPRYVLNGRRPDVSETDGKNKKDIDSTVITYQPNIYYADKDSVLTNIHQLQPIQGDDYSLKMISEPTKLESTTVICLCGGVDFYCTKFAPSGQFDVLSPYKFDRFKLISTIVGLFVGVIVVKPMVTNKRLNSLWLIN